jgi:unsaturated chondroitin disaccharide hydrolase
MEVLAVLLGWCGVCVAYPTVWQSPAELNGDGVVNISDLKIFDGAWLAEGTTTPENFDSNGLVDMRDFALLSRDWLSFDTQLHNAATSSLNFAAERLSTTASGLATNHYPEYTISYASWYTTNASVWTSGFFPGSLWRMYEVTNQSSFLNWAQNWTDELKSQASVCTIHDIGFIIFTSFGNGYRLTGNTDYRNTILQAAQKMSALYSPTVGCIQLGWGNWHFPAAIDTMMNIELLFWASKNGGQASWYNMARSHAYKTRQDFVRQDGSTYHIVDYDPSTGAVISKSTLQGYSTESTWSRGQAWAIYGFTMSYRYTNDPNLLETACKTADYFIGHVPADYVPFWDFNAPGIPNTARDSSAAAIAASGLLELSTLVNDSESKVKYYYAACHILESLCAKHVEGGYLAQNADNNPLSAGILMEGCQNHPDSYSHGTVYNESLVFGDYYFIEALQRYKAIGPH